MTETPPGFPGSIHNFYRPFGPRFHFDEAGAGGAAGAGADGGAAGAGAGGAAKPWHEGLDPIVRGHIDNKGWKVDDPKALVTEMAKAWKGLEQHFGAPADQIIRLPKDASDEAAMNAVYQRLGMPKDPKEYDFSAAAGLDENLGNTLRAALHKAGTTATAAPEVAKAVAKYINDVKTAEQTEYAARGQADRNALKAEWGTDFDFRRLTAMQGAKRAAGSDEAAAKLIDGMEKAIGYKATMEFWHKIGKGTSEDTFIEAGGANPTTLSGAMARKDELMKDPEFQKKYLAGDPKARKEMDSLIQLITGAAA